MCPLGTRYGFLLGWTAESLALPGQLWLIREIGSHLKNYFDAHSNDRGRPLLGVAKSGGFAPLVETLWINRYNVKALVGVAAATTNLAKLTADVVDLVGNIASLLTQGIIRGVDALFDQLLDKIPVVGPIFHEISQIIDSIVDFIKGLFTSTADKVKQSLNALSQVMEILLRGADMALPDMSVRGSTHVVNLYGSIDVLKILHIGGYRDELAGFTADSLSPKPLFNIEIRGAQHSDYYRLSDTPTGWNKKVSDFVTQLLIVSDDPERLRTFLRTSHPELQATSRLENNRWIVEIQGWQDQCGLLQQFC